jgi:uncharacterized phage protein gp47/JayE
MPLQIPTRKQVVQSGQSYFQAEVPEWDVSTSRRSYVGGIIKSIMSALHDWYVALKRYAETETFPQSATGSFLTANWWTAITKLSRNPAAPAKGFVVFTGSASSLIPHGTKLTANALTYTVDHDVTITSQTLSLVSLTYAGGIATATTANAHFLASGQSVTVSGAVQTAYNITATIIVTSDKTFTFTVPTVPAASPATGTPIITFASAVGSITCAKTGLTGNLDSGSTLSVPTLSGVNGTATVTFGGVGGGADIEDIEAFRARLLEALGTDFGTFSAAEIKQVCEQVSGVTRVWVRSATVVPTAGYPVEGQVFIAFMRDNDPSPFPTSQEVQAVKDHIVATILPAHTAAEDVVVTSPTPQPINFSFSALSPDTATMRAAIQASLTQFFSEGVDYGTNVLQDDYRCAIRDTYDPQTRSRLKSFTLASPSGDVSVGVSSLATLGAISWPT